MMSDAGFSAYVVSNLAKSIAAYIAHIKEEAKLASSGAS